MGRTVRVTEGDGSYQEYEYVGETVKVWDGARKWKKYWMDGLGNLVKVEEPKPAGDVLQSGNYLTTYVYDVLNHLTEVRMVRGEMANEVTQVRRFEYGNPPGVRLLSARNPESGTVSYGYNGDGTLASKVDEKGQRTEYSYDSYKRVVQVRRYVGGMEEVGARVDISYDGNPYEGGYTEYGLGRMGARQYQVNGMVLTEMYSYTRAGQVGKKKLRVAKYFERPYPWSGEWGQAEVEGRWEYDAEGKVVQVKYPVALPGVNEMSGGQRYEYGYDGMGRLKSLKNLDDGNEGWVITGATYGPAGELLTLAGVVNETREYNSRLQLVRFNGTVYEYGDNGRMVSETDGVSGEKVVYQYDELNRLVRAETADNANVVQWGQGFRYDGYGNLVEKVVTKNAAPAMSVGVDRWTNRVMGYAYDPNGNQLTTNGQTLSYDTENRVVKVDDRNGTGKVYGYL